MENFSMNTAAIWFCAYTFLVAVQVLFFGGLAGILLKYEFSLPLVTRLSLSVLFTSLICGALLCYDHEMTSLASKREYDWTMTTPVSVRPSSEYGMVPTISEDMVIATVQPTENKPAQRGRIPQTPSQNFENCTCYCPVPAVPADTAAVLSIENKSAWVDEINETDENQKEQGEDINAAGN